MVNQYGAPSAAVLQPIVLYPALADPASPSGSSR